MKTFISIFILLFRLILKFTDRNIKKKQRKKHLAYLSRIKKEWKHIQIPTQNCDVLKADKEIEIEGGRKSEYKWVERAKIICYLKGEEKDFTFEKVVNENYTSVHFKLKVRDFINIYMTEDIEDESKMMYHIDTEFLNEPVNI